MRKSFSFLVMLYLAMNSIGGSQPPRRFSNPARPNLPRPDYAHVTYGPHERNVFDLWLAKSEAPTPWVIYYHGGGFRRGDKSSLQHALLQRLLESGISVAAVNYRLSGTALFPAPMQDCALALQYMRFHAREYNLDPSRVGATGGSAGAGISQWLAFHEDMADPTSPDPIRRQSTRISCAVVYAAQTSYDPRFIRSLFHTDRVDPALMALFGMKTEEDVDDPRFHPLFEEASPIHHATSDDPPVMLFYPQPNEPLPPHTDATRYIHHPRFGFELKKELDRLGVECVLKLREDDFVGPGRFLPIEAFVSFFLDKFRSEEEKMDPEG